MNRRLLPRLTEDNRWFLDTFIRSGETNQTLYAEKFLHPVGEGSDQLILARQGLTTFGGSKECR